MTRSGSRASNRILDSDPRLGLQSQSVCSYGRCRNHDDTPASANLSQWKRRGGGGRALSEAHSVSEGLSSGRNSRTAIRNAAAE